MAVDYKMEEVQKLYNIIGSINCKINQIRTSMLEDHSDTLQCVLPVYLKSLQENAGRMEALKRRMTCRFFVKSSTLSIKNSLR